MGKRILIADADSVVQQVASYFLKLEGFDVEAVGDGVSAMEAIEKIAPDVIVMTPVLPGINGLEVSHFVRENPQYKSIPIIFLAESEEPLLNDIPDLSQKFRIVNKPIDPTKLVTTIKEHLDKGPVHSEDITESLKSIEELLGWEVSEKKEEILQHKEEVLQEKSRERSFDVTEMLSGIVNVPEQDIGVTQAVELTGETFVNLAVTDENQNPPPLSPPPYPPPQWGEGPVMTVTEALPQGEGEEGLLCETSMSCELTKDDEEIPLNPPFSKGEISATSSVIGEISSPPLVKGGEGGFETAEHVEADLKSRITDEVIENMVRKIAVDIVERVTREIVPDIAEREITKEIERLKSTE